VARSTISDVKQLTAPRWHGSELQTDFAIALLGAAGCISS